MAKFGHSTRQADVRCGPDVRCGLMGSTNDLRRLAGRDPRS